MSDAFIRESSEFVTAMVARRSPEKIEIADLRETEK